MKDQESLEAASIVSQLPDLVSSSIDHLFANGVVSTGIIIRCIFLPSQQKVTFEQSSVISSLDLICKELTCHGIHF